jgi:hypothetical protein
MTVVSDDNVVIESLDQVATVYLPDSTKMWLNMSIAVLPILESFKLREITPGREKHFYR